MGVDIRLRDDGDRDALVRLLCEQQPVSGYPVRWPLPGPVEGFIFRDRDEIAWVACDADAADGLERDQGQVRHAPILGERAARTQRSGHNGVMTVRVYLLDDHEIVRRGLAELLASSGRCDVVGESGSAEEATRRIPAARPDVAILDGRLPDGTGMEVCRAVRSVDENIRCLILTSYDDDEALLAAILAGASGYVLKQVRGADLIETIERVAAGESLLDTADADVIRARLRGDGALESPELAALTEQEKRVLDLITQGYTNRQIAGRLHLAEKTVKNYITSLLAKLGLESRTQAAVLMERLRHPH